MLLTLCVLQWYIYMCKNWFKCIFLSVQTTQFPRHFSTWRFSHSSVDGSLRTTLSLNHTSDKHECTQHNTLCIFQSYLRIPITPSLSITFGIGRYGTESLYHSLHHICYHTTWEHSLSLSLLYLVCIDRGVITLSLYYIWYVIIELISLYLSIIFGM